MTSDAQEKSKRPNDSRFKQQQLRAWQPILTPAWVIGTFFVIGAIFVPLGLVLMNVSDEALDLKIQYDGSGTKDAYTDCHIKENNEGFNRIKIGVETTKICKVKFATIPKDKLKGKKHLYVYYELADFYQNHRRYVKSRSDSQLRGLANIADSTLETSCDPALSYKNPNSSLIHWPCGLVALSYFNDGIRVVSNGDLAMSRADIAWKSDWEEKFKNPASLDYSKYLYSWQRYSQMHCYSDASSHTPLNCTAWADLGLDEKVTQQTCAVCPLNSETRWEGGIAPPNGDPTTTTGIDQDTSTEGVRDEGFIVWMRTAGLPTFRKLYGKINITGEEDVDLEFEIVPNFEVTSFNGKKFLVVGTTSWLGGKNNVLGIAYVSVGAICFGLALAFFAKHKLSPRKLGDTQYIIFDK